jgi:hypothetical protein
MFTVHNEEKISILSTDIKTVIKPVNSGNLALLKGTHVSELKVNVYGI